MGYYVELDVSMESTAVCVLDGAGGVILERSVASDPDAIAPCAWRVPTANRCGLALKRVLCHPGCTANWPTEAFRSGASRFGR